MRGRSGGSSLLSKNAACVAKRKHNDLDLVVMATDRIPSDSRSRPMPVRGRPCPCGKLRQGIWGLSRPLPMALALFMP